MAWNKEAHQYTPLSEATDQESNHTFTPDPQRRPSTSILRYLLAAITIVATFVAGFALGSYTGHTGPSSAAADTPRSTLQPSREWEREEALTNMTSQYRCHGRHIRSNTMPHSRERPEMTTTTWQHGTASYRVSLATEHHHRQELIDHRGPWLDKAP